MAPLLSPERPLERCRTEARAHEARLLASLRSPSSSVAARRLSPMRHFFWLPSLTFARYRTEARAHDAPLLDSPRSTARPCAPSSSAAAREPARMRHFLWLPF